MPLSRRASARQQLPGRYPVVPVSQSDVHLSVHEPLAFPAGLHPLIEPCRQRDGELITGHLHLPEP